MNREEFKEKVKQELIKLDQKQTLLFAWRCALRALPFLGSKGNFNFWNKKDRQNHLYNIFYFLDMCAYAPHSSTSDKEASIAARVIARAVAASARAATIGATDASAASAAAATSAAAAAYSAAYSVAYSATTYYPFPNAAASATARAARAADTTSAHTSDAAAEAYYAAYYAATEMKINLESIMLQDLDTIQNNQEKNQHKSTDLYGETWDNFQKALKDNGCTYWGTLFKKNFNEGFAWDEKPLERRITVPKEIRERGAAIVANYVEELEKGAIRLNEARIIVLGDKGAGKTCITRRLVNPEAPMTTDADSTAGVDTKLWKLAEDINVRIWDFAGHTVTHDVHQFFLSERCLYIMVYDGRTEKRNRLEYWLDHMKNYGGDSKAIILVNKRDKYSVEIQINTLKEKYPIVDVYTFSIKDDKTNLEAFRDNVAEYIKNNPSWKKQTIPTHYYQVKDELEKLFAKKNKNTVQEHITLTKFKEIAAKHKVVDEKELLKNLHSLGVCLWYMNIGELDTLVLNPEWISHGVYKIINWVSKEKKHDLTLDEFTAVFRGDKNRYPKHKHAFLYKLMMHYELAYETKKGHRLIIPHLLDEDRPKELPSFHVEESLMLRYKAEGLLPSNTISRFIVRHHQEIKKEEQIPLVWRYGVVLEDLMGSIALIREEDRTISVSVKGKYRTSFISTLRTTLNDIFNSYKNEKPELQYRIERYGQIPDEVEMKYPVWLPDRKILNQSMDNILYYEDITRQHINLNFTVNKYKITSQNLMMDGHDNQYKIDESTHTTNNFYNSNISLQGDLNNLARSLTEVGNKEEAKKLQDVANILEQGEDYKTPEAVKKQGIAKDLGYLVEELENKDSTLHKAVKSIKNGIRIAQDIAKGYNAITHWIA